MPTNKFYNRLSELVPLSNLPGELMRLEDYLEPIYGSLYYRKLQQQGSLTQGKAFYQLDLITYQPISLGIPGLDEMELLILPDEDGNGSSLPVSLSYELPILRYLQNFNITQFDFRRDYFYLLQSFAGLSSSSFLITTAGRQFPQSADFLQDWVSQYNDDNTQTIYPNYDEDEIIYGQNIVGELQNNNINPIEYLLDNYWSTLERQDMLEGFSSAFYERLGDTNETSIKELFNPRINAAIRQTPIGLRFPSFIFREWDDNNQKPKEDANGDDIPTMLTFNSGQINYNSQDAGLSFIPDGSLSFPKSEILKTGFTLEVNDLQVDLKEETDIAEVKEAGYPPDFKGVFIQSATIGLPPFLIPDGTPPVIKGENLIIGTGGFSGKLTLDAGGQLKLGSTDGFSMGMDAFSLNFQQNSITDSAIKGWLKIPGFKQQGSSDDAKIGIEASFENNGDFHITADQNNGLQIIEEPDVMKININSLEVGREDNDYYIALYRMVESPRSKVGARNVYSEISNTIKCTEEELLINYV